MVKSSQYTRAYRSVRVLFKSTITGLATQRLPTMSQAATAASNAAMRQPAPCCRTRRRRNS